MAYDHLVLAVIIDYESGIIFSINPFNWIKHAMSGVPLGILKGGHTKKFIMRI